MVVSINNPDEQYDPDAVGLANGTIAVVWTDNSGSNQNEADIRGRLLGIVP